MAVLEIVKMGHPALKRVAEPVSDPSSPEIVRLVADMRETLEAIDANGLAAPQVQVNQRVVVYRVPAERIPKGARQQPVPWTVMINPVIVLLTDEKEPIWERCLSLPGLYGKVPRYTRIHIAFTKSNGERVERDAAGFHAMLLQHECDHLDGILYPMRMTDLSLLSFVSELGDGSAFYRYTPQEFDQGLPVQTAQQTGR
jgi:peptide deformylase